MLQNLKDTNPCDTWLAENFQGRLDLASGRSVVINFNIDKNVDVFDAEKVIKEFGDGILADIENEYGEYLSVAAVMATTLNIKISIITNEVIWQSETSHAILRALERDDYYHAAQSLEELVTSLLIFETQADAVWTRWVDNVCQFIKAQDIPEYLGM